MRWSIIRLIWVRELRDQLRDRRTVFMIAVLPILLYPLAGFGLMHLALGFLTQRSLIGLAGAEELHPWPNTFSRPTPELAASCFSCTPPPPGCPGGLLERVCGAGALALAQPQPQEASRHLVWLTFPLAPPGGGGAAERLGMAGGLLLSAPPFDYPRLIETGVQGRLVFSERYLDQSGPLGTLQLERLSEKVPASENPDAVLEPFRSLLLAKRVDLLLVVPPGFQARLFSGERPELFVFTRERDETSRLVNHRVNNVLGRWRRDLREVRLARAGLPGDFDQAIRVTDPERAKPILRQEEENLFNVLARFFPFILVVWSLAGALYPAVDLCAGEKERGTMETLLISPASREEIVWGKFLTIWVFSGSTALLNLVSMVLTTAQLTLTHPGGALSYGVVFWGVVLLLPLSAFFSAICLAVGAYARSSKEGQHYLMPLFLLTMPLIFLTLAPGVELNPFYSMVPVTGVALLLQKLVTAETQPRGLWLYFIPVLAPMVIYSWLALRWAIGQFNREDVLFREAERLDLRLWLRRLLREKEPMPNSGEALCCFGAILLLRWFSFGIGQQLPLLTRTGISQLAFVLTPPLFMAMLLTTRPLRGLGLRWPPLWAWPVALVLALLVVMPLAELTVLILNQFPALQSLLELNQLAQELRALARGEGEGSPLWYYLVLAVIPALCEELAFRGFILQGLLRGFRPWTAILLSAFLFSLYQMNVFQFVPHFVFGVVLGLLVVRTASVLPSILFHLIYNSLLIAPLVLPKVFAYVGELAPPAETVAALVPLRLALSVLCTVLAAGVLAMLWWLAPAEGEQEPGA